MAHILLTGATGTAGAAILHHALSSPSISKITILSRRPVTLAENQPKAHVVIHNDFTSYPPDLIEELRGATACIWAQGKTSRGMSEEDYTRLTLEYPVAAAKAFSGLNERFNFVYMSGEGARLDEKGVLFARVKGRAENSLLRLQKEYPSLRVYNVRPGGINPGTNFLAQRKPDMQDRFVHGLGNLFEVVWKGMVIPTETLAKACVKLALGNGDPIAQAKGVECEGRMLRCVALRRLGEEGS